MEDSPQLQKHPENCSGSPTGASPVFAGADPSQHTATISENLVLALESSAWSRSCHFCSHLTGPDMSYGQICCRGQGDRLLPEKSSGPWFYHSLR